MGLLDQLRTSSALGLETAEAHARAFEKGIRLRLSAGAGRIDLEGGF